MLEIGLRAAGFGDDFPLFSEVPGYPDYLRPDPVVAGRFFAETSILPAPPADAFRRDRKTSTFRIFVQGGSTAAGFPYGHGASFPRVLRQHLIQILPDRDVEVVNTAMAAVSSHTLRDFVGEIAARQPDAVLVYAGHNEYYGALGVASRESLGDAAWLVQIYLSIDHFRVVQVLRRAWTRLLAPSRDVAGAAAEGATLMEEMARDREIPFGSPQYVRGVEQFRRNMTAVLCRYRDDGVPVFIGTVASNERDQPPFVSGLASGVDRSLWSRVYDDALGLLDAGDLEEARTAVEELLALDEGSADVHYLRGMLLLRESRASEARGAFLRAKDLDQLRFRAPEDVNAVIRDVARECGATVVDTQDRLAAASPDGIIGSGVMLEHLHPNADGYFLLAEAFLESVVRSGLLGERSTGGAQVLNRREVLVTALDSVLASMHVRRLANNWPFQPEGVTRLDTFRVSTRPEELALDVLRGERTWADATASLGAYHESRGELAEALRAALALASEEPYRAAPFVLAANLLVRMGRYEDAGRMFDLADRREPSVEARQGLGRSLIHLGRADEAIAPLRRALVMAPRDEGVRYDLAVALAMAGRSGEARAMAESVLRDNAAHSGAARLLDRLAVGE